MDDPTRPSGIGRGFGEYTKVQHAAAQPQEEEGETASPVCVARSGEKKLEGPTWWGACCLFTMYARDGLPRPAWENVRPALTSERTGSCDGGGEAGGGEVPSQANVRPLLM